ncbi:transient receptor potential cation channel subfamily A member 1-like isoform X2 [Xenia sp. Carnegie-2017]|uniref:transient receptor potential cation channel subfamily A member 1-like isoform X2 n=1 Tax=Xenia sp. Carnegie-2017 TaxID=2897299 RepID=UPI001F04F0F9|nr:transient receptor potential cation channel subfamily A member 1-like isoform X2 [Xenia sp. Carnegie-2017]
MEMAILQNCRRNANLRHEDNVEGIVSSNSFHFPLKSLSDEIDTQDGKNDVEQLKLAAIYDAYNGESVLHVATRMGDEGILRKLLENKLIARLVNHVESENGRSPLHFAAKFNHLEIAKMLLEHYGKITRIDTTERSPLYIAAYNGHAKMLDFFLKQGKYNVNDLRKVLYAAVNSGDESTVKVFLEHHDDIGRDYLQEEINDSYLIHKICKKGMENILSQLVSKAEDIVAQQMKRRDEQGFTPLHQAVINDRSGLVRYIGSMNMDFVNEKTEKSQSALVLAAERGYQQVVEELLDLNADFNIRDGSNGNRTVLHYAIAYPEILKILLKKNDRILLLINAKREGGGYTPIHDAAYNGLLESVRILLEHGANPNVFSTSYRTPLYCAVLSQNSDVVELILVHKPALINKVDDTWQTPLHTAAKTNSSEVVKCLLNNGAIMLTDKDKSTPLHIAAQHGQLDIVKLLVEHKRSMIDRENDKKRTALLEAASHGKINVVKYLLDEEAAITKDGELFGCLDYAILNGDKDNAIAMVCHDKWDEIIEKTMYGPQGTMANLISKKMSEVAYQVLCKSMIPENHPKCENYKVKYDFKYLQNNPSETSEGTKKFKPLTAIKNMVLFKSYKCLRHPVCCKFLEEKWKELGCGLYMIRLFFYMAFLISLNVYATNIPPYNPSVKSTELPEANIDVKAAMVICLVFTGIESLNEIIQILVNLKAFMNYLLDPVNLLQWILYAMTIIFAVPCHENIAAKTSSQWKACSIALFCAWINLAMYLRRFASYGIIIQMMWKILLSTMKAKMIIDIERKKYIPWMKTCFKQSKMFVKEEPNKKHGLLHKFWEIIFYGPDFSSDPVDEAFENIGKNDNMSKRENCKPDCKQSQETLQKNKENESTVEDSRRFFQES